MYKYPISMTSPLIIPIRRRPSMVATSAFSTLRRLKFTPRTERKIGTYEQRRVLPYQVWRSLDSNIEKYQNSGDDKVGGRAEFAEQNHSGQIEIIDRREVEIRSRKGCASRERPFGEGRASSHPKRGHTNRCLWDGLLQIFGIARLSDF